MMKRMTSWFCDVCGCRSDILQEICPNGCKTVPDWQPTCDIISAEGFRSGQLNTDEDMVRVKLDMTKQDWRLMQKQINIPSKDGE
tara:strand:+ start:11757 stop:12011 length:255 start_codon:yes stop_codon:yes gene_type:complete